MGLGDRDDRDIIFGSAKKGLSKTEIEFQTIDIEETIILTIDVPI